MREKTIFCLNILLLLFLFSCSKDTDCPDSTHLSNCDQSTWLGEWEPLDFNFDPNNESICLSSLDLAYDSSMIVTITAGSTSRKLIINEGFKEYTIYDSDDCDALEIGDDLLLALFANTRYRLLRNNLLEARSRLFFFAVATRYYRRIE